MKRHKPQTIVKRRRQQCTAHLSNSLGSRKVLKYVGEVSHMFNALDTQLFTYNYVYLITSSAFNYVLRSAQHANNHDVWLTSIFINSNTIAEYIDTMTAVSCFRLVSFAGKRSIYEVRLNKNVESEASSTMYTPLERPGKQGGASNDGIYENSSKTR